MDAFATYLPVLIAYLPKLKRGQSIIELGGGYYSTPILSEFARINCVRTYCVESSQAFLSYAKRFENEYYKVLLPEELKEEEAGIVFIDNDPPESRGVNLLYWKDRADYLIAHDTEQLDFYGYREVIPQFKFSREYRTLMPFTTVMSNRFEDKKETTSS